MSVPADAADSNRAGCDQDRRDGGPDASSPDPTNAVPTDTEGKMPASTGRPTQTHPPPQPTTRGLAAKRVLVGGAGGLAAAGIALGAGTSWSVAALCATNVASLVFVVWVWASVRGADPAATARLARAEDASRAAAEAVLIGAGAASLLAVAFNFAG